MNHNFADLDDWCADYLARLKPSAARSLMRQILLHVRRENQKTMRAQTTPDGKRWPARKPQDGKTSRKRMFSKLAQAKHLKVKAGPDFGSAGFYGGSSRLARTHHFGLREKMSSGVVVRFAERELIGMTPDMKAEAMRMITAHMAGDL